MDCARRGNDPQSVRHRRDGYGNLLATSRGAFVVTQECITTPLIPVYLAGVAVYPSTWRGRSLGVVAAVPLFVLLGIVRLLGAAALVVASPVCFSDPRLLSAAPLQLFWSSLRRCGATADAQRGIAPLCGRRALGAALIMLLRDPPTTVHWMQPSRRCAELDDPQGAIGLLPPFQVGLYRGAVRPPFAHATGDASSTGSRRARRSQKCGPGLAARRQLPIHIDAARPRCPRLGLRRPADGSCRSLVIRDGRTAESRGITASATSGDGGRRLRRCFARHPSESSAWNRRGRHHDPFTVMEQFGRPITLGAYSQPLTDIPGALLAPNRRTGGGV